MLPLDRAQTSSTGKHTCPRSISSALASEVTSITSTQAGSTDVIYSDVSSGTISFTDLAGAPHDEFNASLVASGYDRTFIVTPMAMWYTLLPAIADCMELDKPIFPHLDLDHVSESINSGALHGLCLGVYTLSPDCVSVPLLTH